MSTQNWSTTDSEIPQNPKKYTIRILCSILKMCNENEILSRVFFYEISPRARIRNSDELRYLE